MNASAPSQPALSRGARRAFASLVLTGLAACGGGGDGGTNAPPTQPPPTPVAPTVSLAPSSLTLTAGQTGQLTATLSGATASTVVWSSSAGAVATVAGAGGTATVTAVAQGTATITATTGTTTATAAVEVRPSSIGPAGGTVDVPGLARVVVPRGAVDSSILLSIDRAADLANFSALVQRGTLVRLGPAGTSFKQPVSLTLPIPQGRDTSDVGVAYVDTLNGLATLLDRPSSTGSTATGLTGHFSLFALANPGSFRVQPGGTYSYSMINCPSRPLGGLVPATCDDVFDDVRMAFGAWAAALNVTFQDAGNSTRADFQVRFRSNVLATVTGQLGLASRSLFANINYVELNDREDWYPLAAGQSGGYGIFRTVHHEIGHHLGLAHPMFCIDLLVFGTCQSLPGPRPAVDGVMSYRELRRPLALADGDLLDATRRGWTPRQPSGPRELVALTAIDLGNRSAGSTVASSDMRVRLQGVGGSAAPIARFPLVIGLPSTGSSHSRFVALTNERGEAEVPVWRLPTVPGEVCTSISVSVAPTDLRGVDQLKVTFCANVVAPPTATKLAFNFQPANGTLNTTLSPPIQVIAQNTTSQPVSGATGNVVLSLVQPGTATLSGTLTRPLVNGVATFNDLRINVAGCYTLLATSSPLSSATSAPFSISSTCGGAGLGVGFGPEQFAMIAAGSFRMGSTNGYSFEQPVRAVTISRPFLIQRTEVTQGQWRQVMAGTTQANPSFFTTCGDSCPVELVSWNDIQTFLQRLNAQDPSKNYRLPTEAEWEYAARARTTGDYGLSGSICAFAWVYDSPCNARATRRVAQGLANAWGLYDMHGNVWEWVQDWYAVYPSTAQTDPTGPANGSSRVQRGGSWAYTAFSARSAFRSWGEPSGRYQTGGFRLARTP